MHEPALEHLIPPILDPAVNDAGAEIADGVASCSGGLKAPLEMGVPLVLIGWVNQPYLELSIELLEGRQLLEGIQVAMIATLEGGERLPVIK